MKTKKRKIQTTYISKLEWI